MEAIKWVEGGATTLVPATSILGIQHAGEGKSEVLVLRYVYSKEGLNGDHAKTFKGAQAADIWTQCESIFEWMETIENSGMAAA